MKAIFVNRTITQPTDRWTFERLGDDPGEYELAHEIKYQIGEPVIYSHNYTTCKCEIIDIIYDIINGVSYLIKVDNKDVWVWSNWLRPDKQEKRNQRLKKLDI